MPAAGLATPVLNEGWSESMPSAQPLPEAALPEVLAELRGWGIRYLSAREDAPADVRYTTPWPAARLFVELARAAEPRMRDAAISLLLLHPELAGAFDDARHDCQSSGEILAAEQLTTHL